jgi:hypothetical protein
VLTSSGFLRFSIAIILTQKFKKINHQVVEVGGSKKKKKKEGCLTNFTLQI